jgi:hypothetical protein
MALTVQMSDEGGTRNAEKVSKRIRDCPAVQLVRIRGPEHDNARAVGPTRSIETGKGPEAEAAPQETSKGNEAGHATAEPNYSVAAKVNWTIDQRSSALRHCGPMTTFKRTVLERRSVGRLTVWAQIGRYFRESSGS